MNTRILMATAAMLAGIMLPGTAAGALTVATNPDVSGGLAAFGTSQSLLDWSGGFAPGSTWTRGSFGGPASVGGGFTDAATGAKATGSVYVTNWIDGAGFDAGADAAPDLALNGPEDFLLGFAAPVNRIGFAVATGRGLLPNEVNSAGTSFTLLTSAGESALLTLTDPGNGLALWVDVQSTTAFTSLRFTETLGDRTDQYFGNFVAGTLPATGAVPEPASWAMLIAGFGLTGAAMRRRALLAA